MQPTSTNLNKAEETNHSAISSDYNLSLKEIEKEMDEIWFEWDSIIPRSQGIQAKGKSWNSLQPAKLGRMKWLAKRRMLLIQNKEDWGVLITWDRKNPLKCYAHPVSPGFDGRPARPEPPKKMER